MTRQARKAQQFRGLHVRGKPLILFNIWDAGSAKAVAAAGVTAVATSSWSVANANGYADGEQIPLGLAIDNLRRVVAATDLPVTMDIESGYGDTADEVGKNVALVIDTGAVGCNLEDSFPSNGKLREVHDQCERIRRARQAGDSAKIAFFINARTDVFLQRPARRHIQAMCIETIERAHAYADAGASGLFTPGLQDLTLIGGLTKESPLPLNIMVDEGTPSLEELAKHGVARISHGPRPYLLVMKELEKAARVACGL